HLVLYSFPTRRSSDLKNIFLSLTVDTMALPNLKTETDLDFFRLPQSDTTFTGKNFGRLYLEVLSVNLSFGCLTVNWVIRMLEVIYIYPIFPSIPDYVLL